MSLVDQKCEWCKKYCSMNNIWSEGLLCDDCSDKFVLGRLLIRCALRPDLWGTV